LTASLRLEQSISNADRRGNSTHFKPKSMPSRHVNDVQHWRECAAHMRALSLMMSDVEAQAIMERLANHCDELAGKVATHVGTDNIPKPRNRNLLPE